VLTVEEARELLDSIPVTRNMGDGSKVETEVEPYGESGKYKLIFSERAKEIGPIPFGDAPLGAMQGPRYTTLAQLKTAKKLTDLAKSRTRLCLCFRKGRT
jgi:hypothetical protein